MARKIQYKVGDVFLVPLEEDFFGVGRVLINEVETIFIELYRMKPIRSLEEYNYANVSKEIPILRHWCYDTGIREGAWEIIDHQSVEGEIDMPLFWTQDAGDLKYYIRKGSADSFHTIGERVEILKENIHNYEPYGIGNENTERNRYIKRLRDAGLY